MSSFLLKIFFSAPVFDEDEIEGKGEKKNMKETVLKVN